MIRRLSLAAVIACLTVLMLVTTVLADYVVTWGAILSPILDETGANLADGNLVQLIHDVECNGVAPPDAWGNPTGLDVVVASSSIGTDRFAPGTGQFVMTTETNMVGENDCLYVRAWNAASVLAAEYYGNSPIFVADCLTCGVTFDLDCTVNGSFGTDDPKPPPLAVDLSYFTATSKPDHVLLAWETVSETGIIGFNLHRGESAGGPWQKLNPQPIPTVTPGGAASHEYTWADTTAPRGRSYHYRLDEVLTDGSSKPIATTAVSHGGSFLVWLPVTYR